MGLICFSGASGDGIINGFDVWPSDLIVRMAVPVDVLRGATLAFALWMRASVIILDVRRFKAVKGSDTSNQYGGEESGELGFVFVVMNQVGILDHFVIGLFQIGQCRMLVERCIDSHHIFPVPSFFFVFVVSGSIGKFMYQRVINGLTQEEIEVGLVFLLYIRCHASAGGHNEPAVLNRKCNTKLFG